MYSTVSEMAIVTLEKNQIIYNTETYLVEIICIFTCVGSRYYSYAVHFVRTCSKLIFTLTHYSKCARSQIVYQLIGIST